MTSPTFSAWPNLSAAVLLSIAGFGGWLTRSHPASATTPAYTARLAAPAPGTPSDPSGAVQPVRARHGMVASSSEEASRVGVGVMQRGGNAVDAAVAVGFALAVTLPSAGNLGGGGFMLVWQTDSKTAFLDFRETAPAAARPGMYLDSAGQYVRGSSLVGYRAIGVPGSVAGMVEAQARWGKRPLRELIQPAIRLAEEGFVVNEATAKSLQRNPRLARFPESRRIFQRNGDYYRPGERFRQPELARTLRRIAAGGGEEFYRGKLAQELAAALQRHGAPVTAADLREYKVRHREPLVGSYRGHQIITAPPPSSGGVALLETLNILEGTEHAAGGPGVVSGMHWQIEAMRRAYADRSRFLGDPDFVSVPVQRLTDKAYAAELRRGIDPNAATSSLSLASEQPSTQESAETTHYSVVDGDGNAVACTTTLNSSYGSGVTAEGLGFLLNNEMDDFMTAPGVPNTYGLVQGPANEIRPGKRPLSSMAPTIVTRDGKLFLVVGSPGGPRIISTVLHVLTGIIDYGLDVQQAVDRPRFHHQWLPDTLYLEIGGFAPETVAELKRRGHTIKEESSWSDAQAVMIDPATGERLGGGDSRGSARPVGY
jgi:gamma-glutamyltranspeptidase / glutathione hydrolase